MLLQEFIEKMKIRRLLKNHISKIKTAYFKYEWSLTVLKFSGSDVSRFSFLKRFRISPFEALLHHRKPTVDRGFPTLMYLLVKKNSFGGGGKLNRNNTYKTEIILFSWELYGSSVTSGQLGILVGSTVWVTTRQWIHCSRVWQNRFHALAVGEFFILLKTYKRYGLLNFIVVIYFRIY